MSSSIKGYERQESFGIRNYVLVISTVHCANTAAERIAAAAETACIEHEYGCVESAVHHERTCMGLISAGTHPNVCGAVVVGLGCEQTDGERIVQEIRKSGRMAEHIVIQEAGGMSQAVERGISAARKMTDCAERMSRVKLNADSLIVGVQCGGSDWTTAIAGNTAIGAMADLVIENGGSVLLSEVEGLPGSEHIVAGQAVNRDVGLKILDMVAELRQDFFNSTGSAIENVNPTPGNKAGGITTLTEKSIGNIRKMGSALVQGVLKVGQKPPRSGLWILDNRCAGPDSFNITGFALSHAHAVVFSTGRGTPVGNAVMPVIKITGNSSSYESMRNMIDFSAETVLEGESIEIVGKRLYDYLKEVASGNKTASERNGNREFTIPY